MKNKLNSIKKNISLMFFFIKMSHCVSKSYIWLTVFSTLLGVISNYNYIIMPKMFIDELLGNHRFHVLTLYLVIFVLITLVVKIISYFASNSIAIQRKRLDNGLQSILNENIINMDFEKTEDPYILDLREQAVAALNMRDLQNRMIATFATFLSEIINIVTLSALISILNPIIIVILISMVLLNNLFSKSLKDINFSAEKIFNLFFRRLSYFNSLTSDFSIGKDARIYNIKGMLDKEFDNFNEKAYSVNMHVMKKSGLLYGLMSINEQVQMLVVYIYIAYQVFIRAISIGDFTMYVAAATQLGRSIFNIFNNFVEFKFIREYIDIYVQLLKIGEVDKKKYGHKIAPLNSNDVCIEFRNVFFKYPRAEQYTLKNINIVIKPNEKLSVIGENGAGKTTFVKLLCGLYTATSGEILLNGVNIKEYDYDSYLNMIAVVFQDFKIFSCSVKENVAFDSSEDNTANIRKSLKMSGVLGKIEMFEHGMDTQVFKTFEEDGIEFSGGENQKMAIARAVYKDSPLIVMDEPTASLDPYSEYEIFKKMNEISQDKTVVFISHRLSSCRLCDKIVVFNEGEIIQYGTHDELIQEENAKYYEMYSAQSQYYV